MQKSAKKPIYIQIYNTLHKQIMSGHYVAGQKLTSTRNHALELGVSRSSVIAAYDQLEAEGYIEARLGSGFYVTSMGNVDVLDRIVTHSERESKSTVWTPHSIQNQSGAADMRLFPYHQWARCVARVARESPKALVDVNDLFGDRKLRESISNYLFEWRGINVSPKQIVVTAGSIDALEICIRTLLKKNDLIGLEDPGYPPLRRLAENMSLSPVWLPVHQEGAQIPASKQNNSIPKLVVLTPSHHFPLGGAMSPGRRIAFLDWAEQTGAWIIEDDYDSEFRYAGKPIPALTSFKQLGRSIYVGSFSKIFSTGLRLGFLVVPESLQRQVFQTLTQFGSKASVSMQRALSNFMDSGEFYRHIRRVRRIYSDRRKALIEHLKSSLEGVVSFEDHQAGIQFTAILPNHYDDVAIAHAAQANNIHVAALSQYYATQNKKSGLLISFCVYEKKEIYNSVRQLKTILKHFKP